MPTKTILFDIAHNEMLNVEDKEFNEFFNLLRRTDLNVKKSENEHLSFDELKNVTLLIIGNPIDDYFSSIEIKEIVDFVRSGGALLLLSEYGSDYLQKTNLNDIASKFGISFEKNLVKEVNMNNQNCTSILHIQDFIKHTMTKHLREVRIGGACSLFLSKNAEALLQTNENSWPEIFNSSTEQWTKEEEEENQIIAAFSEFGQGKVVAIGDIDIFTSDSNIGINSLDNKKFIQNVINWLITPVKEPKVMSFLLNQLGEINFQIRETNKIINNIIETMTILEKRISYLEEHNNVLDESGENEENMGIESQQRD
ncbi:MAG: DUF4350 domain-containing protein [Promethearchaeota archaeon]|jgi:hypothetical protein